LRLLKGKIMNWNAIVGKDGKMIIVVKENSLEMFVVINK